jgi:hypothetical protein
MKFVVRDTIFSPAADEIKALILQAFNTKSDTPTNLHYEKEIHFTICIL